MGSPVGSFLCPPEFSGPQGLRALAREASALTEAVGAARRYLVDRSDRRRRAYATRHPESGLQPVVLVPGFMAGDSSLAVLSGHLRRLGHRTYRSAIRANVSCTQDASERLEERIEAIAAKRGRRVAVVGHSLGGLLARGVAARRPDLVDQIVTLGSPLLAPGAAHPLLLLDLAVIVRLQRMGLGRMMGADCTGGDCARLSWEQATAPLVSEVGFISVFSRRDGIIDWRACLDPAARTVEVRTSHLGMAYDPVVLDVVTGALAERRGAADAVSARPNLRAAPSASAG